MATIIVDPDGSGDYTSFSAAESAERVFNGSETVIFECKSSGGTGDDAISIAAGNWGSTPIEIRQADSDKHNGVFNSSKYRATRFTSTVENLIVDGIQFQHSSSLSISPVGGLVKFRNCIIDNTNPSFSGGLVILSGSGNTWLYNNIIYYSANLFFSSGGVRVDGGTAYVENNTIHLPLNVAVLQRLSGTLIARNNLLVQTGGSTAVASGIDASSDYNATNNTGGSTGLSGGNDRIGQTFDFEDSDNNDYRITTDDTGALSFGTDNVENDSLTDIASNTWGSPRSIGAFEANPLVASSSSDVQADEEIVTDTIKKTIITHVYEYLINSNKFKNITIGYQNKVNNNYLVISKNSTALEYRDTCLDRHEKHIFNFQLYDDDWTRLKLSANSLRDVLDWSNISFTTRRFENIEYVTDNLTELERGKYLHSFFYEIYLAKSKSNFQFSSSEGSDFFEALYNRYLQFQLEFNIQGFVISKFGKSEWDLNHLYVPNYESIENFRTTLTRIDSTRFSINYRSVALVDVENVIEKIDNVFSYCQYIVDSKQIITIEWLGETITELEPNIWGGSVEYEIMQERLIT